MQRRSATPVLGAVSTVAIVVSLLAGSTACSGAEHGSGTARPQPRADEITGVPPGRCPVTAAQLLTAADARGMSRFVWQPSVPVGHQPPAGASAARAPVFVRQFVCGAFVGFITNLWRQPRWRAENDRQARALGYSPGSVPLVPFRGSIVQDHPTAVLELYERVMDFRTVAAARAYFVDQLLSVQLDPAQRVAQVAGWPSNVTLARHSYGVGDSTEVGLEADWRDGTEVLLVRCQGGRALTWQALHDFWATATSRRASG